MLNLLYFIVNFVMKWTKEKGKKSWTNNTLDFQKRNYIICLPFRSIYYTMLQSSYYQLEYFLSFYFIENSIFCHLKKKNK